MPLHQPAGIQRNRRRRNHRLERPAWIGKHLLVMGIIFAQRIGQRSGLLTTPGAPRALQIVGRVRWHIVHDDSRNTADIHTHFHRSRAIKDVDLSLLEHVFVSAETLCGLLSRMLRSAVVETTFYSSVVDICPQIVGTQLSNSGILGDLIPDFRQSGDGVFL